MSVFGDTVEARRDVLNRAGLQITLSIDPSLQDTAQNVINSVVGPEDAAIAVADTVENATGRILAMAQSRPVMGDGPGETAWNYSVELRHGRRRRLSVRFDVQDLDGCRSHPAGAFPRFDVLQRAARPRTGGANGSAVAGTRGSSWARTTSTTNAVPGQEPGQLQYGDRHDVVGQQLLGVAWSVMSASARRSTWPGAQASRSPSPSRVRPHWTISTTFPRSPWAPPR